MKITFAGTSHGVPAAERFCSCTMIESNGTIYFIDAGAPMVETVLRAGKQVSDIRAFFSTHIHGDHTCGIYHLADLVDWYYTDHAMDFYFSDEHFIPALCGMIKAGNPRAKLSPERLRFHVIDPDVAYEDENIRVDFIPTKHMPEPYHSFAMLVTEKSSGKRALFSGDLSHKLAHADVPRIVSEEELDLFVCEMAHFDVEHVYPYLETCKAKTVCFQHVFPLVKYDRIKAAAPDFPFPILTPNDGDVIEL